MYVGAHESASGGPYTAVERALDDECEALQLFTKNNNRWTQRMWTEEEAAQFRQHYAKSGLKGVMSHSAYLINLCSKTAKTVEKSKVALADELTRCAMLGIPYLVLHPGSHTGQGEEAGLRLIAENLERVYETEEDGQWQDVTLLFENTAGQGTCLGWRFEHLADLFERVFDPTRFGVCFDTCHAHAAGYDLTERESYEAVWQEFDAIVGLDHLKAFHLNDSKKPLGSRVDRHELLGEGEVGLDAFRFLVNDDRFADIPAVVETPPLESGEDSFAEMVALLKGLRA
ncbi:deoxyribonuclease IV [Persicimonas caeni]|uniref:Probable endonuclease 4 n=1 Tax=Persicimonas caeni TaxID=2292766 RepID=A0A4Y6Q0F9_PERCE|nr:deoxyribonuclease IV [Persicimonas caeni]QDG54054.1 deoxyribonuclease IV [Persicimonas caeni]QED35275.1 deoxyribonuclease IV [Persicimonas caeni]